MFYIYHLSLKKLYGHLEVNPVLVLPDLLLPRKMIFKPG